MKPLIVTAALLALSPAAPRGLFPTEVYRIALPEGALPESWAVELPAVPGAVSATIDLELVGRGGMWLEHLADGAIIRPFGRLYAWPDATVRAGSEVLHTEEVRIYTPTKSVAKTHDGVLDYGGDSGSTVWTQYPTDDPPSPLDPALLAGGVVVDVEVPAEVAYIVIGSSHHTGGIGAYVGGALVVRVER